MVSWYEEWWNARFTSKLVEKSRSCCLSVYMAWGMNQRWFSDTKCLYLVKEIVGQGPGERWFSHFLSECTKGPEVHVSILLKDKLNQYQAPEKSHPGTPYLEDWVSYPQVLIIFQQIFTSSLSPPPTSFYGHGGENVFSYSLTCFDRLDIRGQHVVILEICSHCQACGFTLLRFSVSMP